MIRKAAIAFAKVAGMGALLIAGVFGFQVLKLTVEWSKGCVVDNPMALNPIGELVAMGENGRRALSGDGLCSWGFKPKSL